MFMTMKNHQRGLVAIKIVVLSVFLMFTSSLYAQEDQPTENVTIKVENATIKSVLDYIEESNGYLFFFSKGVLDLNRKVTLNFTDVHISVVLDSMLKGTDVDYEIKGNQVSLKKWYYLLLHLK